MSIAAPNGRTVIYFTGCTPLSIRCGVRAVDDLCSLEYKCCLLYLTCNKHLLSIWSITCSLRSEGKRLSLHIYLFTFKWQSTPSPSCTTPSQGYKHKAKYIIHIYNKHLFLLVIINLLFRRGIPFKTASSLFTALLWKFNCQNFRTHVEWYLKSYILKHIHVN